MKKYPNTSCKSKNAFFTVSLASTYSEKTFVEGVKRPSFKSRKAECPRQCGADDYLAKNAASSPASASSFKKRSLSKRMA